MAPAVPMPSSSRVAAIFTREARPDDVHGPPPDPKAPARKVFERIRVPASKEVDVGMNGIIGSMQFNSSIRFIARGFVDEERPDRGVLVQTAGNINKLLAANLQLREPLGSAVGAGSFGENLFLDSPAWDADTLCIGDEITCFRRGAAHGLRLRVVSPRLPCGKVDQMLGKTYSSKGVRAHCAQTAQGGLFCRVLQPGTLQEGDELKITARPHPDWSLARTSSLLYGHPTTVMQYNQRASAAAADQTTYVIRREEFMGSEEELRELAEMPELATVEFKEHVHKLLGLPGIGRFRPKSRKSPLGKNGSMLLLSLGSVATITAACMLLPLMMRRAK